MPHLYDTIDTVPRPGRSPGGEEGAVQAQRRHAVREDGYRRGDERMKTHKKGES